LKKVVVPLNTSWTPKSQPRIPMYRRAAPWVGWGFCLQSYLYLLEAMLFLLSNQCLISMSKRPELRSPFHGCQC